MPIQVVHGLFLKLKSRIFPGVWFARRNVEGTVYINGTELPADAGDAWVGIMGFGDLRKASPVELTYRKGDQLYRAFIDFEPGAFYVIWGDRLLVEERAARKAIPLTPAE
jgi:hypothetical protein